MSNAMVNELVEAAMINYFNGEFIDSSGARENLVALVEATVRRAARVADECDTYEEYDMNGMVLEEFGLTR